MSALVTEMPMAKKRGRPKQPGGEGTQVRIDPLVASKARMVASANGKSIGEYLSDLLRGIVDKDFAKEMRKVSDQDQTEN
jgi:hypothetical protein